MIFVVAAVLIGIAGTVSGEGCCTPDQWQGYKGTETGYNGKKPGFVEGDAFLSYDALNKRLAVKGSYSKMDKSRKFDIVVRYSDESNSLKWCAGENCGAKGKMYIVDLKDGKCFVKKLRRPFHKMCIPEDAKSVGKFRFGAGNNSLAVESFSITKASRMRRMYVEALVTVTADCVPVVNSVHGSIKGVGFMSTSGFGDITPGIKDPSIFDVPKECEENVSGEELPDDIGEDELSNFAF